MTTLHVNLNDDTLLRKICKLAYPDYKGRTIKIRYDVKSMSVSSYWDGGSRDYFVLVDVVNMEARNIGSNHPIYEKVSYDPKNVVIPLGYVVVKHSIFQGKDMGLTIYTTNSAPLLPTNEDLTPIEKNVLYATRSYKSSYAGASDCRAYELRRALGYSLKLVEETRQSLIEKGFMRKNKSITNEGKNAIADMNRWIK